jgi:MarR family
MPRAGNVQPCSGPPGLHNGTRPQTGEGNLTCFYWCECPQGMAFREQTGGQLDTADRARASAGGDRPYPRARIRDIAATAGLSQRTVQAIIADLEAAGYLTRTRSGRRTVYCLHHPPRPPVPPPPHKTATGSARSWNCWQPAVAPRDAAVSQPAPAGTTLPRPADSLADPRRRRARTASGLKGLRTGALPPLAVPVIEPRSSTAAQSTFRPAPGVRTRGVILAVATLEATSQAPAPVQIVTVPPGSSPSSAPPASRHVFRAVAACRKSGSGPSGRVSAHSPCQHDRRLILTGREEPASDI